MVIKECLGNARSQLATLNVPVEPDDVDIRVAQKRFLRLKVQGHNARTAKGLHPTLEPLSARQSAYFSGQPGLDALTFEGRNERREILFPRVIGRFLLRTFDVFLLARSERVEALFVFEVRFQVRVSAFTA